MVGAQSATATRVSRRVLRKTLAVYSFLGFLCFMKGSAGIESNQGTVTSITGVNVTVNFPSQSGWSGKMEEMELVAAPEA